MPADIIEVISITEIMNERYRINEKKYGPLALKLYDATLNLFNTFMLVLRILIFRAEVY